MTDGMYCTAKRLSNSPDNFCIHGISKRLTHLTSCAGQVLQCVHTLEPATLSWCHIPLFPGNDRDLSSAHCYEGWSGGRPFYTNPRSTELNYKLPYIALFTFA